MYNFIMYNKTNDSKDLCVTKLNVIKLFWSSISKKLPFVPCVFLVSKSPIKKLVESKTKNKSK